MGRQYCTSSTCMQSIGGCEKCRHASHHHHPHRSVITIHNIWGAHLEAVSRAVSTVPVIRISPQSPCSTFRTLLPGVLALWVNIELSLCESRLRTQKPFRALPGANSPEAGTNPTRTLCARTPRWNQPNPDPVPQDSDVHPESQDQPNPKFQ